MSHFAGFIFDLDGVLVDTRPYHFKAWQRLALEMGFELQEHHNEELRGLSRMASLEKIMEWGNLYASDAEKLFWSDVKNNWYIDLISRMKPSEVLPGVLDFLESTRKEGIRMAVVSSSKNARAVLRSVELEHYFAAVIDGNFAKKVKPAPDCFLLAAQTLRIQPAACLVFEDAPVGVEAARKGGFSTVAVGRYAHLCGADWEISGFEHLSLEQFMAQVSSI